MTTRANAPVFVVGCHRSGTALLYDSLLSAGGFPLYRAAPYVHTTLLPMCGNPSLPWNREKMLRVWLDSKPFRRTGFDPIQMQSRIRRECRSGGDLLRITLGELARRAGAARWAVHDCDNIMHMPVIKREIPESLFVHVVRDGRDAALSMMRQHGKRQNWWARRHTLFAWALLWAWTVRKGRHDGQQFPNDYIEIHYEDLVRHPEETLRTLGAFLNHDLDHRRIQATGFGRVGSPNTVWMEETNTGTFNPVNRWKTKLSTTEIAALEAVIGDCLKEFDYALLTAERASVRLDPTVRLIGLLYPGFFSLKLFLRSRTLLGRLAKGTRLELAEKKGPGNHDHR